MPWYKEEDIERAKQMTAIEYLKRYEPSRLKKGRNPRHEYELTDHDSFKINEVTSQWHWKSRDIGGNCALRFLTEVNGMSFQDAMQFLLGQDPSYIPPAVKEEEKERVPFVLPERAPSNERIGKYLRERGISREVFTYCQDLGILYESVPYHNAVFVGLDEAGRAKYAFLRGIYDQKGRSFKLEQAGSDKAYCFCVPPVGRCRRVAVYEAAIEALAHMTLEENRADKWRLSLGGIYAPKDPARPYDRKKPLALEHFLKVHPEVTEMEICTNNDQPGRAAAEALEGQYGKKYQVIRNLPWKEGADYGDLVKERWRNCCKEQRVVERRGR